MPRPVAKHAEITNFSAEEPHETTQYKFMIVLLGLLAILHLVVIPFMIAANHHTAGTPPVPAIVVVGIVAVATLVSAVGVARGLRWAFWGGDYRPDHRRRVRTSSA